MSESVISRLFRYNTHDAEFYKQVLFFTLHDFLYIILVNVSKYKENIILLRYPLGGGMSSGDKCSKHSK